VSAAQQVRKIASRFYNIAFHDFDAAQIDALNALVRRVSDNLAMRPAGSARRATSSGLKI
jgi:hypothetical protein